MRRIIGRAAAIFRLWIGGRRTIRRAFRRGRRARGCQMSSLRTRRPESWRSRNILYGWTEMCLRPSVGILLASSNRSYLEEVWWCGCIRDILKGQAAASFGGQNYGRSG